MITSALSHALTTIASAFPDGGGNLRPFLRIPLALSGTADDDSAEALGRAIKDDPDMHMWQRVLLSESLRRLRSKSSSSREQGAREIRYARQRLKAPKLDDHPFWRAGEAVSEWAEETFPAGKGYEQSFGREVGQGLGSLVTGVAASALVGPIAGGVLFSAMGAGEAADRAVQAGATDEEIVRATAMGLGAGATDILPAEMLLRRLPLPGVRVISEAVKRFGGQRIARAIGRIGMQATVEAVQEGGQQALQNLISREVHSPETVIMEGVEHGAGIGGIVGGIAGLAREGIAGIAGRRSRSARGARAKAVDDVPPPSPEDEASPIPTADIVEGREIVADAMAVEEINKVVGEHPHKRSEHSRRRSRSLSSTITQEDALLHLASRLGAWLRQITPNRSFGRSTSPPER